MKKILLKGKWGEGKFALVDDDDFAWLNLLKWYYDNGYAIRREYVLGSGAKNKKFTNLLMHQLVAGTPKGLQTDHINRNTLDNRRENLRIVTAAQNRMNRTKTRLNKSGYKGVSLYKRSGKWVAFITLNKKTVNLGHYITKEEAAKVYDAAAKEHYGEYAVLNFPKGS